MSEVFPSISILIPNLKSGDEVAWNELCERFRIGLAGKTRNLIRTTGGRKDLNVDDLVQETFFKAWKQRATFRGQTTAQFAKWLLTILRNTFIDHCSRTIPEDSVASWYGFQANSDTPSSMMISFEQEAHLHACLAELDPKYQRIINLRIFAGYKFAEIAAETGLGIHTVTSTYRRGIRQWLANLSSDIEPMIRANLIRE